MLETTGAYLRALYRQLFIKNKLRTLYLFLVDREYRDSIRELLSLKITEEDRWEDRLVRIDLLDLSHKIVYPDWVTVLETRFLEGEKCEKLKVMYIESTGRYKVLDGNHRTQALYNVIPLNYLVRTEVLIRK